MLLVQRLKRATTLFRADVTRLSESLLPARCSSIRCSDVNSCQQGESLNPHSLDERLGDSGHGDPGEFLGPEYFPTLLAQPAKGRLFRPWDPA